MADHDTYLSHRDLIERTLALVCRRHRLTGADAEDFSSSFHLRLLENDCAPIRKFRGRSSMQTYLVMVISHFFQDWRNARWGKWRSSAEARRLGPVAVHLEILLVRDGMPFDAAVELLRSHHGVTESVQELEAMAIRFPRRTRPTFVADDDIDRLATPAPQADATLEAREASAAAARASVALREAVDTLSPQDKLFVRMIVEEGLSIADVARGLHLDQKPLYARRDRLFADLRRQLEERGLTAGAVADLLTHRGFDGLESDDPEMTGRVRLFSRGGSPVGQGDER